MKHSLALFGDINLMHVTDPAVPFRRVRSLVADADCRFANLECCLIERDNEHEHVTEEGFFAPPAIGEALARLQALCDRFGTKLQPVGDKVLVWQA